MKKAPPGKEYGGFFSKMRENLLPISAALVSIAVAGVLLVSLAMDKKLKEPDVIRDFWVDEETGDVSLHATRNVPPIKGKGGRPTVVIGYFITYGSYKDRQLVYLKKYEPDAKDRLEKVIAKNPDYIEPFEAIAAAGDGLLVRRPGNANDNPWVKASSDEGRQIMILPPDANGRVPQPIMPDPTQP